MPGPPAHPYRIVDVFTQNALEGNALAVFLDGSQFDTTLMQRIAKETNLSETVFLLPPVRNDCAARIRIFTPARELIFAGHPTVGSAFVLLQEGIVPAGQERFLLQEQVGAVPIRIEHGDRPLIWLRTPPIEFGRSYDPAVCAEVLGLAVGDLLDVPPQLVSAGNPTIFVAVKTPEIVDRALLEMHGLRRIKGDHEASACVFVFAPAPEGAYSRMFAPELGIVEDPATGSSTGPLAAYMLRHELVAGHLAGRFLSEQGTKMGRRSLLHIRVTEEDGEQVIEIGGYVTSVASGSMSFNASL